MKNTSKKILKIMALERKYEDHLFFHSTLNWGAREFSVYNHMYIPRDFGNPEQNFGI